MYKNNGTTEQEKLQNRFTAFVCASMSNARINYLKKESCRAHRICDMEDEKLDWIPDEDDFVSRLCDSDALSIALKQLDDRERHVLFARALQERSFEDIAEELGLKYKGVAAIYYRTTAKLRDILGGN